MIDSRKSVFPWSLRLGASVLLALVSFALLVRRSGAAEPFVVVVNAANPITSMSAQDVSKALLKKLSRWPDGVEVTPVDLREQSEVRDSFSRQIHDKGSSAVKAYWQKMIFSGREVPPLEKATSADVVAFVRANRGAIGYVAADTNVGSGVKILRVVP